jgi:tetratricopeptide (TPR) repeat protein
MFGVFACGPWLSWAFVNEGPEALLEMPAADFMAEVRRLTPGDWDGGHAYVDRSTWDYEADAHAERVRANGGSDDAVRAAREDWLAYRYTFDHTMQAERWRRERPASRPGGLSDVQDAYLDAAEAWHRGDFDDAVLGFHELVEATADAPSVHTVWATYGLARVALDAGADDTARERFAAVRRLVDAGAPDPLGLAEQTWGWEARMAWNDLDHEAAAEGYLRAAYAGDPHGVTSLQRLVDDVTWGDPNWPVLADTPLWRGLITARLVSRGDLAWSDSPVRAWLDALESLGVTDDHDAAHFAWSAWQAGEWTTAEHWLALADDSPLALWLRAKVALRAEDVEGAAGLLAQASAAFDPDEVWRRASVRPSAQAAAELGVLELSRGRYVEALEAFERSGRWLDVAWLLERVLTLEEAQAWVDERHPTGRTEANPTGETASSWCSNATCVEDPVWSARVRHLLGRRLVREGRGTEARGYLPPSLYDALDAVLAGLAVPGGGVDKQAAATLWTAARTLRHQGIDLAGTELGPDSASYWGSFDVGDVLEGRQGAEGAAAATPDELERARAHLPDPAKRFHYRYRAAELARRAAMRLPADSMARVQALCVGGRWLAARDPEAADVYYKAMVNQGWNTELGALANTLRWFPDCSEEVDVAGAEPEFVRPRDKTWVERRLGCATRSGAPTWMWLLLLVGCRRIGRRVP